MLARISAGPLATQYWPLDRMDMDICTVEPRVQAVTWDHVVEVAHRDPSSQELAQWI